MEIKNNHGWKSRPSNVKNAISKKFSDASKRYVEGEESETIYLSHLAQLEKIQKGDINTLLSYRPIDIKQSWSFNGEQKYRICAIDDFKIVLQIIKDNPNKKVFNFLDVGAGDFSWSTNIAEFLSTNKEIPQNIKINIFGVRAEKYNMSNKHVSENVSHYKLGDFKIENILDSFKNKRIKEAEEKFDFIISSMTLRHLADPVGTFQQIQELSHSKTGVILIDGFQLLYHKDLVSFETIDQNLIELFNSFNFGTHMCYTYGHHRTNNEKFYKDGYNFKRDGFSHFILKRTNSSNNDKIIFSYNNVRITNNEIDYYNGKVEKYSKINTNSLLLDKSEEDKIVKWVEDNKLIDSNTTQVFSQETYSLYMAGENSAFAYHEDL